MKRSYLAVPAAIALGITLLISQPGAKIHADPGSVQETAQPADSKAGGEKQGLADLQKRAEVARQLVVAKVNGTDISMLSLVRTMNRIAPQYVKPGDEISEQLTEKIKKEALDRLIFEEMAIQASYKQGITVAPEEIEKVIANVKEGLGSDEAYQQYLERLGLTEEQLRDQIERGRRREIITAREIYGKVKVADEKIKEEYGKLKKAGKLRTADEFIIKEILLMKGEDGENTHKRAEQLLAKVKENGGDFGQLVLDGTFITRRMRIEKDRFPVIYKQMRKMEVGELSGVVEEKNGTYHVFKVVKKEPAHDLSLEEARGYIENRLRVPAQEERKAAWEKELREKAEVEILLDQVDEQLKKKAEIPGEEARS